MTTKLFYEGKAYTLDPKLAQLQRNLIQRIVMQKNSEWLAFRGHDETGAPCTIELFITPGVAVYTISDEDDPAADAHFAGLVDSYFPKGEPDAAGEAEAAPLTS